MEVSDICRASTIGNESPEFFLKKLSQQGFSIDNTIEDLIEEQFIRANEGISQLSISKITVGEIGTFENRYPIHREVFEKLDVKYFIDNTTVLSVVSQTPIADLNAGINIFEHCPIITSKGFFTIAVEKIKDNKGNYKFFLKAIKASYMCFLSDSVFIVNT